MNAEFDKTMAAGYALTDPALILGRPMLDDQPSNAALVQVALSILNRHGLIAGATGTGKTKTLQLMAGQLSRAGVPTFVADIKGDLTGMAAPGDPANPKVSRADGVARAALPAAGPPGRVPVADAAQRGAQVRATVSSFGPLLLGKVLDLNETQTSILSLIFKYCDDNDLPLLDLKDLATTLKFLDVGRGQAVPRGIRRHVHGVGRRAAALDRGARAGRRRRRSSASPSSTSTDLLRTTRRRPGRDQLLELADVMDKPRLFSTFMLWILAQLYESAARGRRRPEAQAVLLLRRGAPALRRRVGGADGADRAHGAADPLEGRRRLLRHAVADGRALERPVAARQPRPARAARVHARGRRRAAQDRRARSR